MSQANPTNQKRVPIRRRVMSIVLLTTLIALLAASVTGIICIHWIKNSSETALTDQLESNLKSIVQQKAVSADAKLEHYEKYIELATDYIEGMYKDEDEMIDRGQVFYPPRNTKKYFLTRGFASEDLSAKDFTNELRFFSNLKQLWEPIAKENEDLITTVYAGSKSGLLTSYDRYSYLSVPPKGETELVYNYFDSSWYKQGMKSKGIFYTGLYVDSQGRGLTLTVASPFRNANGEIAGVDCADFDITGLYNELLAIDLGEGTFSFALDKDGSIISPDASEDLSITKYTGLSAIELEEMNAAHDGILETDKAVYVYTSIDRVGWTLCACVPREVIQESIHDADRSIRYAYIIFIALAILIIFLAIVAVNKAVTTITHPMEELGRDMQKISEGDLNYRASVYRNDEIGDITNSMNEMMDRLNSTMNELTDTQMHADAMSRLATLDSLTGVRNKTAFDEQEQQLEQNLAEGDHDFGFVMIDLNNLKVINDNYGHDKGDISILKLCDLVCEIFDHSPVFRIGGDEFVVVLQNNDSENIESLVAQFEQRAAEISADSELDPWERISAAIGYALYDETLDTGADSVLTRADMAMYKCKRAMKQARPY